MKKRMIMIVSLLLISLIMASCAVPTGSEVSDISFELESSAALSEEPAESDEEISDELSYETVSEQSEEVSEPEVEPEFPKVMYVNAESRLNMREGPSLESAVLTKVNDLTQLDVYEITDGWARVKYRGEEYWCSAEYLTSEKPKYLPVGASTRMYVLASSAKLYSEPDYGKPLDKTIKRDREVYVYQSNRHFSFLLYDGAYYWCLTHLLGEEKYDPDDPFLDLSQIKAAQVENEKRLEAWRGRTPSDGRKTLTDEEAIEQVENYLFEHFYMMCNQDAGLPWTCY